MVHSRKLPIGIQDFEKLRRKNFVYVDKTDYIYDLVTSELPYFLGRPRRFGKSLFLSTLKAYFLGKKELFEGLKIAELETEWIEYPVLYIDMSVGSFTNEDSLKDRLNAILENFEQEWGKTTKSEDFSTRFEALIRNVHKKTKKYVVVLIDEYDKPLLNSIDKMEINSDIHTLLKSFYSTLKSADQYLRFVFLTGVTKFSRVSVFSDLNHLIDISMDDSYTSVCGISETEITEYFAPEIDRLAEKLEKTHSQTLAELKRHYNGYHFSENGEGMYNPFSLLNTFKKGKFSKYWFETGTPSFLVKILKNIDFNIPIMENEIKISADAILDYRFEFGNIIPLLYQSGYLTIKSYDRRYNSYTLGFPNEEVKYGFLNELLPTYMDKKDIGSDFYAPNFVEELQTGQTEAFMTRIRAFLSSIPYELNNKTEKHYQTIFYLLFNLMGQFVEAEQRSAAGRADAVVITASTVYVFEFKIDENASAEDAIKQINDKGYLIPFSASGKRLVKVGAEFSIKERTLSRWIIEEENISN